jgi:glycolate oxidase FAD binding subunit
MHRPETPQALAEALRALADARQPIRLGGNFSKSHLWRGLQPAASASAGETVSTSRMNRLLAYDPRDLTISVEAGMPFAELQRTLAEHRQMLPLDPPWLAQSTVGGVVAANLSGPLRRQYGTARDMIIGMTFATLEGKLVASGGMVVKNVAGLDMAKLMIGSFGTLAAIAVVNFKVFPMPPEWRTLVWKSPDVRQAFALRDRILQSPLQPSAIDIDNLAGQIRLAVRVGGSPTVLDRWSREHPDASIVEMQNEPNFWADHREFPSRFLEQNQNGSIVPLHCKLADMPAAASNLTVPFIARAGSGVIYTFLQNEPNPVLGGGFEMMTNIKRMFDPEHLLNRGRLHGRL